MTLSDRIEAFSRLGEVINLVFEETCDQPDLQASVSELRSLIDTIHEQNPWFTPENIQTALESIAHSLTKEKLLSWTERYPLLKTSKVSKQIGVTMAGNIPLVGFHDFLSVLISGHRFIGKLSSKDNKLLPAIAKIIIQLQPEISESIYFTNAHLTGIDAIIATGSDNSARYFDYYFSKYPNIIRKNRNGISILTGSESNEELVGLGVDIFCYFGLGCRNISKLYIPNDYDFTGLISTMKIYESLIKHRKYYNNYWYNRARFIAQQIPVIDIGFVLLKEDPQISSPPGVIFYEYYNDLKELHNKINLLEDRIQCIVSHDNQFNPVQFGKSQFPELWDYADNIDTLEFLTSLNIK